MFCVIVGDDFTESGPFMRVGLVVIACTVRDAEIPLVVTKGCGQVGKGGFLVLKS